MDQTSPRRQHHKRTANPAQARSGVSGIAWPAPPGNDAAGLLSIMYQLQRSQWWRPEDLRAWQFRQTSLVLEHARKTVPYYRTRLDAAGFAPGKAVTPETWAQLPILTRDEVQSAGTALHSRTLPPGHGPVAKISSSGSTGRPIETLATRVRQRFWDAFSLRDHLWHRRDFAGTLASIRAFPTGTAVPPRGARGRDWGGAAAQVYATGRSAGLSLVSTTAQQAEWLARVNPDYLLTFPTALRALAEHCRVRGIALPRLRQARTISEVLTPKTRIAVRAAWGVEIADAYSANEVGYMALQCPEHEVLHVQSEGVVLEILREDGQACEAGEVGRVVVTPLHNFAMPLIRYELGDYAEAGGPCPCGRGLPVIARVLGRVRNMLRLPDGREVWPLIGEPSYSAIPAIRQYQMVQTSFQDLEMKLVVRHPLTPEDEAKLRNVILTRLGHRFEIAFSYHDEIPRGPGGKFEDFRCEIAPAKG